MAPPGISRHKSLIKKRSHSGNVNQPQIGRVINAGLTAGVGEPTEYTQCIQARSVFTGEARRSRKNCTGRSTVEHNAYTHSYVQPISSHARHGRSIPTGPVGRFRIWMPYRPDSDTLRNGRDTHETQTI